MQMPCYVTSSTFYIFRFFHDFKIHLFYTQNTRFFINCTLLVALAITSITLKSGQSVAYRNNHRKDDTYLFGTVRVVLVVPIWISAVYVRRGIETMKPTPAQHVSRIGRLHPQRGHAPAHLHIFGPVVFGARPLRPRPVPSQRLSAEHVAAAAAVVALRHDRPESVAEKDRIRRVFRRQEVAQVLDDDVGVVVDLHEPVGVVVVVFVDVVERLHRLRRQVLPALLYGDVDRRERGVFAVADEQEFVAATAPRGPHVTRLRLQVFR